MMRKFRYAGTFYIWLRGSRTLFNAEILSAYQKASMNAACRCAGSAVW